MLSEVVEHYLAKALIDPSARRELLDGLKSEIGSGRGAALADLFPRLAIAGLDYSTATSLHRLLQASRREAPAPTVTYKIAVLGSVTTKPLIDLLDLYLQPGRIDALFYEADYDTIQQEFLDPNSGLHRFQPDCVIIVPTWRDLRHKPLAGDDAQTVKRRIEAEVAAWATLWSIAAKQLEAQVIQSNFAAPPWRVLGNLEARQPNAFGRYIAEVNTALADAAPPGVTIHDADQLACAAGRWAWSDPRFYHQAKLPCAPEYLVDYAHSLAALVLAQSGAAKKCLVLDLDGTLWGGVIGDDGLGGIRLGHGDPEGEAFTSFQTYIKSLAQRGVIIAICSKNDEAIARQVFDQHPEMVLRAEDVSCFVVNWDDKATNLGRIAEKLNISLNSLVFFDNDPAERSLVRRLRPEVAVPEVPADPSNFIQALDQQRYFEALSLSGEDLQRSKFYQANEQRQALESSATDIESFLKSLNMAARIQPIDAISLERAAQLISRSNQFNLTTRRYSSADLASIVSNPDWMTLTVSLSDRFGDNGLISVLLAHDEGDALMVDTWVMSCRVLKRGVERLLLNHLVANARSRGRVRILGEYLATPKNALVGDHYEGLGFARLGESSPQHSRWELNIDSGWSSLKQFIRESD
jgi:FkbH-like protein